MSDFATPAMLYTALVTMLTVVLFFYTGVLVGRMRGKHAIKAPAMTGHPEFERAVRVQMNTLENAVAFIPALWVSAIWFGGYIPAAAGVVWLVGRILYMFGYMSAPEKRSTGFLIQSLGLVALIILGFWGVFRTFLMV